MSLPASRMLIDGKRVPLADLEIVEVVRRRDLDRAGALLRVGIFVGDDRDQPADERQTAPSPTRSRVALVVRMHGDAGVAEHGLRAAWWRR